MARILQQHPAYRDDIADLVTRRPVPGPQLEQLDPFLFLNHHGPQTYAPGNRGLPFGPHPHRGFETVTFILAGELAHLDSGGHESIIKAGGVQWMTAGSGLVHAELSPAAFKRQGGPLEILQLWVNLPARLKMTDPAYIGLQREQIPQLSLDAGRVEVAVVSGEFQGTLGAIQSLTGITMLTVTLKPGGKLELPTPAGRQVFCYTVGGELSVAGEPAQLHHLLQLNDGGESLVVESAQGAVLLFGHAAPIGEPVVSHGPFVMNTREEIVQAIDDYQRGLFGSIPG
ncbi:pirin family protein [Pseudomonas sp. HR96]|uniref:pirin family protein n=1 Tax=Pseudomonas sp. HR96 TaxID=1027966 RepID=UPI002A75F07C|nr:pirin family protein [Pseudomonas sp. HR96]WPP01545.1 pirin family protein [Pseudomonas sp. HR96]